MALLQRRVRGRDVDHGLVLPHLSHEGSPLELEGSEPEGGRGLLLGSPRRDGGAPEEQGDRDSTRAPHGEEAITALGALQ